MSYANFVRKLLSSCLQKKNYLYNIRLLLQLYRYTLFTAVTIPLLKILLFVISFILNNIPIEK